MHNAWTVVATSIVAATIAKGLCDYLGTYLVNYAGFGMITDLRNHLYEATLRRSASFFHKHATGTILSTLINDVDRVQLALSSVIGEFLQQFFTFRCRTRLCHSARRAPELGARAVYSRGHHLCPQDRQGSSHPHAHRAGQARGNPEHPARNGDGNRIVKAFNTEIWEILRFRRAAKRLFRANLRNVRIQSISSPLMDTIGAIAIALFLFIGRNEIQHGRMTMGSSARSSFCCSSSTIPFENSRTSTTASSRPWARRFRSSVSSTPRMT